jgi:LEM3-like protein
VANSVAIMRKQINWQDTIFLAIREAVAIINCSWSDMDDYISRGIIHISRLPIHKSKRMVYTRDVFALLDKLDDDRYGVPIVNLPSRQSTPNIILCTPAARPPRELPVPFLPIKRYFVYILRMPNGNPFYVGKGTSNRPYEHINEARRGECICRKCRVIQLIHKMRKEVLITYEFQADTDKEVLEQESELIRSLCRSYQLTNRNGNPYYDRPLPFPESPALMAYDQVLAYLDRMPLLVKKERDALMAEWRDIRIDHLNIRWRVSRQQHRSEEEAQINAELETLMTENGEASQWMLPFYSPNASYSIAASSMNQKKRRRK